VSDKAEHLKQSLEHILKGRRKQVVIFLDNSDQRGYEVQEEVFLISQELAAHWPAAVFMTIRPGTFHRSKSKDALSGYHAKAFSIAPPRIDLVVDKRLKFALRLTSGEIPCVTQHQKRFNMKFEALDHIIRAFLFSFHHNRDLAELLDNISNGNVRLVLDLIQQYLGSGHVDTERIYQSYRKDKFYFVSLHEFIRAIMYGDNVYYEPNRTPFVNLFDITAPDPKEHFLMPLLVATIQSLKSTSSTEGFVDTRAVFQRLQNLGFTPSQVEQKIIRGCQKLLIEATARKLPEAGNDMPPMLRNTSVGLYHINKLCTLFTYMDAIVVDLAVLDNAVSRQIKLVINLPDRLHRVGLLKDYLTRCWASVPAQASGFDWIKTAQLLEEDMVKVDDNSKTRGNR